MHNRANQHITILEKPIAKCKHNTSVFDVCKRCAETFDNKFKKTKAELSQDAQQFNNKTKEARND
jgi:ribosome-binding protein aMBF1 (putative translation factor)|tara:strand:- start:146 stop:340 length:195 start_codon:yes stop_codon:yes gene_type:complete